MSKAEDEARQAAINDDPLARVIHDAIDALPHAMRLYPDLYAQDVAEKVRALINDTPSSGMRLLLLGP